MNYQFLQTNSVIVGENRDLTIKSVISYNAEFFFRDCQRLHSDTKPPSVLQLLSDLNSSFSFLFSTDNRESFPVYCDMGATG